MSKALRRFADGRIATTASGEPIRYDAGGRPHASDRQALIDAVTWQIAKDGGMTPDDPKARRQAIDVVEKGR